MTRLRVIDALSQPDEIDRLLQRSVIPDPTVQTAASEICDLVRLGGDAAVAESARRVGGGFGRIPPDELAAAAFRIDTATRAAIETSIAAVERYHRAQVPRPLTIDTYPGVRIERRWSPLRRVGAYVPGGKAVYPSTVVMTVVPARLAGVGEIALATPASEDGTVPDVTLAAARLAGATEVWAMGGAQAIAALAYGTESVKRVDKIVGPGGGWVTAAKLAVYGACDIDLPAGPSEVLIIGDSSSDPTLVAVDLLCQAEHGPDSPAVLITSDPDLPDRVNAEIERLLADLDRAEILAKALTDHGVAVIVGSTTEAIELANEYAAEHVTVATAHAEADADRITSAGSIYVGEWAPESAGDYATGANHVLPTGGMAASCGPLSVDDFGSWRQVQHIDRTGLENIEPTISALATAEGLTAHRLAAQLRLTRETQ